MLFTRGNGKDVVSQKKVCNIKYLKNSRILTVTASLEREITQVHNVTLEGLLL